MPWLTGIGLVFAIVMAIGFLTIPIYIYLFIDPPTAASAAAMMGGLP
jgi:hypothetical protein